MLNDTVRADVRAMPAACPPLAAPPAASPSASDLLAGWRFAMGDFAAAIERVQACDPPEPGALLVREDDPPILLRAGGVDYDDDGRPIRRDRYIPAAIADLRRMRAERTGCWASRADRRVRARAKAILAAADAYERALVESGARAAEDAANAACHADSDAKNAVLAAPTSLDALALRLSVFRDCARREFDLDLDSEESASAHDIEDESYSTQLAAGIALDLVALLRDAVRDPSHPLRPLADIAASIEARTTGARQ